MGLRGRRARRCWLRPRPRTPRVFKVAQRGESTFRVPRGVTQLKVTAVGEHGAARAAGSGAEVVQTIAVTRSTPLTLRVGNRRRRAVGVRRPRGGLSGRVRGHAAGRRRRGGGAGARAAPGAAPAAPGRRPRAMAARVRAAAAAAARASPAVPAAVDGGGGGGRASRSPA